VGGSSVDALQPISGGDILVGGTFTSTNTPTPTPSGRFARYRPTTTSANTWQQVDGGIQQVGSAFSFVTALCSSLDGDVYVGGRFSSVGSSGVRALNIARYRPSRTSNAWSRLELTPTASVQSIGVDGDVFSLLAHSSGDIYIGGQFTTTVRASPILQIASRNIVRFTPSSGVWSALRTGIDGVVRTMVELPDGDVLIGGEFNTSGNRLAPGLARWRPGNTCPVDFDCSGIRDVADIFAFLSAWFAADPRSDFNASGVRDVADIFAFLSAWFAGC